MYGALGERGMVVGMKITAAVVLGLMVTAAHAQMFAVKSYGTSGHPVEAYATADEQYVLVTVASPGRGSGIEVFRNDRDKLKQVAFQPLGQQGAQGIVLIPKTRTLAVGVSNAGVAFLSLDEAIRGKAQPKVLPQGEGSGSGYLAVSPDGKYLFVANEYGQRGNIGVVALQPDAQGNIHPATLAHIPTMFTTPGVTISADGSRVYAVGEVTRADIAARIPGHGVPELERSGCVQGRPDRPAANGVLYAIDVAKAAALRPEAAPEEVRRAVVAFSDAGCSPVREAMAADGTLYVTARGDNAVLAFDAAKLENDRGHSFLRSIPSGGVAPVGLRLSADGKTLVVANSNRFEGGAGKLTVFDVSDPAKPVLKQTIKTGAFPRNIVTAPDGKTMYATVFSDDQLLVLTPQK